MILSLSGYTEDKKPVLAGLQKFVGTHGLPLEDVLFWCREKGLVVDWIDFITDCLNEGWKFRTIKSRITSAVGEIYGKECRDEITKRLRIVESGLA